jgi:hypothetical protein
VGGSVNVFNEVTNICAYSAVVATIEIIITFGKRIPTGFGKILFGISTNWARKIKKAFFLLLEIT